MVNGRYFNTDLNKSGTILKFHILKTNITIQKEAACPLVFLSVRPLVLLSVLILISETLSARATRNNENIIIR